MTTYIDKAYNWFMERFIWLRYKNRPYLEYYRALMEYRTKRDPVAAVGGNWDKMGLLQFERLQKYGMKPHHTLFDFGCGTLRGGIHAIRYLDTGHYTGNDISNAILESAQQIIEKENLAAKNPKLILTKDIEFSEVAGNTYDYMMAQSVLSHMPPEDIERLFKNVKKIMHKDTIFLATFFLSENEKITPSLTMKNYSYPYQWIKKTAAEAGLDAEMVDKESKQKLLKITLQTQ